MIVGIFNKPLAEEDVSYRCISDANVNQLSNRDDEKLFIALLINGQFSNKILQCDLRIFNLKYKGEV